MVGKGPYGNDIKVSTDGVDRNVAQYTSVCNLDPGRLQVEGDPAARSRSPTTATARSPSTTAGSRRYTVPGSFPAGGFNVVFKDHNYTPDKDGMPVGYTWHWDNIIVK